MGPVACSSRVATGALRLSWLSRVKDQKRWQRTHCARTVVICAGPSMTTSRVSDRVPPQRGQVMLARSSRIRAASISEPPELDKVLSMLSPYGLVAHPAVVAPSCWCLDVEKGDVEIAQAVGRL